MYDVHVYVSGACIYRPCRFINTVPNPENMTCSLSVISPKDIRKEKKKKSITYPENSDLTIKTGPIKYCYKVECRFAHLVTPHMLPRGRF